MKSGKKWCDLGKSSMILGNNSAIFSQIQKVYLLKDFSANWECF